MGMKNLPHKIDKARLAHLDALQKAAYDDTQLLTSKIVALRNDRDQILRQLHLSKEELTFSAPVREHSEHKRQSSEIQSKVSDIDRETNDLRERLVPSREKWQAAKSLYDNCLKLSELK